MRAVLLRAQPHEIELTNVGWELRKHFEHLVLIDDSNGVIGGGDRLLLPRGLVSCDIALFNWATVQSDVC